jgi:hypothetical protein
VDRPSSVPPIRVHPRKSAALIPKSEIRNPKFFLS